MSALPASPAPFTFASTPALRHSVMAQAIDATDWSTTPLGSMEGWSLALRATVRLLLGSRYPMFVWWGPGLVNLYNDAYIEALGQRHPWALGQPAARVWHDIWDTIGPQVELVMEEGRATWNDRVLLVMTRNGFVEETYFTFSYSPAFDDDGQVGGMFCACSEETGRVLSERRLQSLRRLSGASLDTRSAEQACASAVQALATNAHDLPLVLIYRTDGGKARRVALAGLPAGHAAAPDWIDLSDAHAAWPLAQALHSSEPLNLTLPPDGPQALHAGPWPEAVTAVQVLSLGTGRAGQPGAVLVLGISPRRPLDADYRDYLALVRDQVAAALADAQAFEAEQRRAESLAALDRAKTAFFSNVSHELRTPLSLMLGPLAELLDDAALAPGARELITLAERNGRRLQRLVNSLLDFSRIEAGRLHAQLEPLDLAALTTDLASLFRSACERAGLQLVIDCPPLPQPVWADRSMWERIVLNLLSNALKYTPAGDIRVSTRVLDEALVLSVSDTGIGIAAEALPRLFERFFRVEDARGRSIEGSGIGLAMVHELVRLHGGRVTVHSQPGQGSEFRVQLPLRPVTTAGTAVSAVTPPVRVMTPAAEAFVDEALDWVRDAAMGSVDVPEAAVATQLAPPAPDPRPIVLVVDDNADMRAYLRRLLSRDHAVLCAADGQQALALARHHRPDLVLSDVMMPGLDGFGLLRALRADRETAAVPLMLLSARAGEEARIEGLQAGADDYLTKPFQARELLARVSGVLALARARGERARAEAAWRSQLEAVLESLTDGFVAVDADWRFTYVNSAAEAMLDRLRAALLGQTLWEALPCAAGTVFEPALRRAMLERQVVRIEGQDPGQDRWIELQVCPIQEGGLSFYLRDITDQRLLEQALRRGDERRHLQVTINDATRSLTDPAEILRVTTRLLAGHLGADRCSYGELEPDGEHVLFSTEWAHANRPGKASRQRADDFSPALLATLRAGRPFVLHDVSADTRVAGRLGLWEGVKTGAVVVVPLLRQGDLAAVLVAHQRGPRAWTEDEVELMRLVLNQCWEAVERARAEEHLRISAQEFRALADAMPQIVYVTRPDGRLEYINQQWESYTGIQRADTEDLPDVMHPDDVAPLLERWTAAQALQQPLVAEFRLRAADGQYRWFLTRSTPVFDVDGQLLRWYGTSTDIDAQQRDAQALRAAHQALQEADRRKDEFIATLSHELRNPLAALRNAAYLLELSDSASTAERVRHIMRRQVDHLVRLVDDLLEVSRITSGKIELRREVVTLGAVVSAAVETSRPALDAAGHHFTLDLGASAACRLDADPVRLAQVFANLLNNAAKYTEAGGHIQMQASAAPDSVTVELQDNGVGIPAEILPRVFDMFVQAAGAGSRAQGGLGIGLSLVRSLVQLHGGQVHAHSDGPGRGSRFTVTLPLHAADDRPVGADAPAAGEADRQGTHRPRVLIVDDNHDAAESLGILVEMLGATAEVVNDGAHALAAVQRQPPALVLLDIGMPDMDGYEVARHMRALPGGEALFIVALTGWGQDSDQARSMAAGFDHHLVKPVDMRMLEALLKTLT